MRVFAERQAADGSEIEPHPTRVVDQQFSLHVARDGPHGVNAGDLQSLARVSEVSSVSALYRRTTQPMPCVLIIHEVHDYAVWKAIFDDAAGIRKAAGEVSYQLLRYETDANHIVHFSRWTSLENARRFFESPELIEIRRNAGVKAPEFIYLEEIELGIL